MSALLAALGMSVFLPFAVISDNNNCVGMESRWQYTGPITYYINTNGQPFSGAGTNVKNAISTWNSVNSSSFIWTYSSGSAPVGGYRNDGYNTVSFNDPDGDLSGGTLAATVTYRYSGPGSKHAFAGKNWRTIDQMDLVFNNEVNFTANSSIAPGCNNKFSLEAVAIHESGHGLGLDHPDECVSPGDSPQAGCPSCDGEIEGYDEAVMYSTIAPCDPYKTSLQQDDLEAITYLYDNDQPLVYPGYVASPVTGYTPLTVQVTDQSLGASSWYWTFGDGSSSTTRSPNHIYQSPGTYALNLLLDNSIQGNSTTVSVFEKPSINFTANITQGLQPITVSFENLSSGNISSYLWDFGDNTTSTEPSPTHQYLYKWSYHVILTGYGYGGPVEELKSNYIVVSGQASDGEVSDDGYGCQCALHNNFESSPAPQWLLMITLFGLVGIVTRRRSSLS